MVILKSISISGIRSFGIEREDEQTVEFETPLTLLLGQNGCGKTTIIESIRHAIIGDYPKKGGAYFVSDPKLHKTSSVKGSIKLKFEDSKGTPTTVTRVLKLDVKGSSKFASMDSTVDYINDGAQIQRTGKINDITKAVLELVGVSPAILGNVIFCHQEESLWPVDECANVKKKFDQIFDSTKYNTAITTILQATKSKKGNIKVCMSELGYLKSNTEMYDRHVNSLEQKKKKMEGLVEESRKAREEVAPIEERRLHIAGIENSILELQKMKSAKEAELKSVQTLIKDVLNGIGDEFDGSESELDAKIDSFDDFCQERKTELENLVSESESIDEALNKLAEILERKSANLATTKEQLKNYQAKVSERDALIQKQFNEFGIKDEGSNVSKAISLLKSSNLSRKNTVDATLNQFSKEESKLQTVVDEANTNCIQLKKELSFKNKELQETELTLEEVENELMEVSTSKVENVNYEQKIANLNKEISALQASFNPDKANKEIVQNKQEISTLEEKVEVYESDLKKFMQNDAKENELTSQKKEIAKKEHYITKVKEKKQSLFDLVFDKFPNRNIKNAVEKKQSSNVKIVQDLSKKIEATETSVRKIESELRFETSKKDQLTEEYSKVQQQLACYDDFEGTLEETSNEMKALQRQKGQLNSASIIYKDFIKQINEKKCCPVCDTSVTSTASRIVSKLSNQVRNIPAELKSVSEKLSKVEETYDQLLQLKPVSQRFWDLSVKMPQIEEELSNVKTNLESEKEKLQNLRIELAQPEKILNACREIISDADIIDQFTEEIDKARRNCTQIESQLIKISTDRSKDETESALRDAKERLADLRILNDKLFNKINTFQRDIEDLRSKRNTISEEKLRMESLLHKRPQLEEKLRECKEKAAKLKEEIQDLEDNECCLLGDFESAKQNLRQLKLDHAEKTDKLKHELMNIDANLQGIVKLHNIVLEIEKKNLNQLFDNILGDISELKIRKEQLEEKKLVLVGEIDTAKDIIRNQVDLRRVLMENKKLRRNRIQENILKNKIESLRKEVGEFNYETLRVEKIDLNNKLATLSQKLARADGEITSLQEDMNGIQRELENPHLKAAHDNYHKKFIELTVMKNTVEDIETYAKTLEVAIAKFHKKKMEEVNHSIRTLWRQIYTGNDIDYIEVETGETVISGSRRTFSYQLMQRRGDAYLPLRGRCSAGQKVLACLIVRIALAQNFSADCGIFALDEPTTNLDKENVRSLSTAMARLISQYQDRQFQFIIITHDEEFLNALREVGGLDCFYRVSRNEYGRSIISKEDK